jgi:ABC-type antimicrobial peptide transport system permease subunit
MRNKILFLLFSMLLLSMLLFSCNSMNSKIDVNQVNSLIVDNIDYLTRYIDYDMGVICYTGFECISCIPISDIKGPFIQNVYNRINQEKGRK